MSKCVEQISINNSKNLHLLNLIDKKLSTSNFSEFEAKLEFVSFRSIPIGI